MNKIKRDAFTYPITVKAALFASLVVLSCCQGCMTQTIRNEPDGNIVSTRTVWIWQKNPSAHK
jgi:hypothetical protein